MAATFSISAPTNNVQIEASRKATVPFTVTNQSGRAIPGRASLETLPEDAGHGAWLSLPNGTEINLPIATTSQVPVQITVPLEAPPGSYNFRLNMVDVTNPDETFIQGPAVTIAVPEPVTDGTKLPKWLIPLILVVIACLVVGGVTAYLVLRPKGVAVPRVAGLPVSTAVALVEKAGLAANQVQTGAADPAGIVFASTPAAGTRLGKGAGVDLLVSTGPTAAPNPTTAPTTAPTPLGGGAQLAFYSTRDGHPNLFVGDIAGDKPPVGLFNGDILHNPPSAIYTQDLVNGRPAWSPDGKRLAFLCYQNAAPPGSLCLINPDNPAKIEVLPGTLYTGFEDPSLSWSPDGKQIAWDCHNDTNGNYDICTYDLDTKQVTDLTAAIGASSDERHPTWAPDAQRIAFSSNRDQSGRYRIYIYNIATKSLTQVTQASDFDDFYPAWSPDGNLIAYTTGSVAGNSSIYVAKLDGSSLKLISTNGQVDRKPAWSPDGQWIVFERNCFNTSGLACDIYRAKPDGTNINQVVVNPGGDWGPAWRP